MVLLCAVRPITVLDKNHLTDVSVTRLADCLEIVVLISTWFAEQVSE